MSYLCGWRFGSSGGRIHTPFIGVGECSSRGSAGGFLQPERDAEILLLVHEMLPEVARLLPCSASTIGEEPVLPGGTKALGPGSLRRHAV